MLSVGRLTALPAVLIRFRTRFPKFLVWPTYRIRPSARPSMWSGAVGSWIAYVIHTPLRVAAVASANCSSTWALNSRSR